MAQTELLNRRLALATVNPAYSAASPTSQMVNCGSLSQAVDFIDIEPAGRGLPPPLLPSQQPQRGEEQDGGGSPTMDVFSHNVLGK
ncbi:LOB domain-containing protein 4 [Panicum miliaceum]|uniref:LOB domain-containing protein 4 n=1 Tax=Panicum miliaceum TaxID=4540 RepID=A0A3L6SHP8_PANMI|nr:LOB domain-containing protein 4 [Panicum miliaceum]